MGNTAPDTHCSRRGCRAAAEWALVWNNPKLHTPDRRKVWVACDDHREYLANFLGLRGFLRETVPLAEFLDGDGGDAGQHGADEPGTRR
ncbi:hypothetical protein [Nocardiopsis sp. L17-MgMaSL7]|uniref:hypothetical protein n=1 Tax=Nocardiopsis sp. L17-MgMaSL7 TaxID=1938893 RepID=UPI000D71C429|nr:hypothetical protein [Nocardiopsis sp. L17-MgMaSL7]PWV54795.1 hypothetical protein BDW27_104258 [Nocardiopsis sp. L17-MgMaSL7]